MVTLTFTKREAEILHSRLSAPDCIAEALTDVYPGDPEPPYCRADAEVAAERLANELEEHNQLTFSDQVERDVIEDAIDGSTFPYFIADAVQDGDMTKAEAAKWRRDMQSICRKLKPHGIDARFPNS